MVPLIPPPPQCCRGLNFELIAKATAPVHGTYLQLRTAKRDMCACRRVSLWVDASDPGAATTGNFVVVVRASQRKSSSVQALAQGQTASTSSADSTAELKLLLCPLPLNFMRLVWPHPSFWFFFRFFFSCSEVWNHTLLFFFSFIIQMQILFGDLIKFFLPARFVLPIQPSSTDVEVGPQTNEIGSYSVYLHHYTQEEHSCCGHSLNLRFHAMWATIHCTGTSQPVCDCNVSFLGGNLNAFPQPRGPILLGCAYCLVSGL